LTLFKSRTYVVVDEYNDDDDDDGYGNKDDGYGIWDMGYGIWDMGYGVEHSFLFLHFKVKVGFRDGKRRVNEQV
jgi:hypothetical protein